MAGVTARRAAPVAFLLAAPFTPLPAPAQDAALRAELQGFTAEVAAMTDTGRLGRLERRFGGRGATPEIEAISRLRRGVVRLRLGTLGRGWASGQAADDFARATSRVPAWPLGWYWLGLAREAEAAWLAGDHRNLGHRVGSGARRAAVQAFARASELDPAAVPTLTGLVASATMLRDTTLLLRLVLPALRRAATTPADTVTALLEARARLERELGNPDSAVSVARRLAALSRHAGLARLELARSLFARGDTGGTAPYFEGAEDDDARGVTAYRHDLAYIAGDSVLTAFDAARGPERVALLRRFWRGLDRRDLRADGEWLREHYRRLAYARRHFALLTNRRRYHVRDGFDSGSTELDDRGIVYLRHGEPDRIAGRTAGVPLFANARASADSGLPVIAGVETFALAGSGRETWLYFQGDSLYLVEFASGGVTIQNAGDPDDYRLIPFVSTLPGSDDPAVRERIQAIRPDLLRYFAKAGAWGPFGQARALGEIRRAALAGIGRTTTTLSHEPRFARRLPVVVAVVAVGREGDAGLVQVVYAIPRGPSASPDSAPAIPLPVRLRFMAENAGGAAIAVDTTDVLLVGPASGTNDWIMGRFALPLPPGTWRYRLALEAAQQFGRVLPPDSLTVPVATGPLAVSDPALGQPGLGVPWETRPGEVAWHQVGRPLRRSHPLDLYFEVYGLASGEPFRTTLIVRSGRKTRLALTSNERAGDGITRIHRTAALGGLSPGRYTLEVAVTAGNRTVVSRSREIEVIRQ